MVLNMRNVLLVLSIFLTLSCGSDDSGNDSSANDKDTSSDAQTDANEDSDGIPSSTASIAALINAESFLEWPAENSVKSARLSSPHSHVRSYFNQDLADSIAAGQNNHPKGSGVIKILYASDQQTIKGYAAMFKTGESADGSSWYWYESFSQSDDLDGLKAPIISGQGTRACTGCHSKGTDSVFTAPE